MNKITILVFIGLISYSYSLTQSTFETCVNNITPPSSSMMDDCDHLGQFYTLECDYIEVNLLASTATWTSTYTNNYKLCLSAIYSYQDAECNHQEVLDYYDDVAACVDSNFTPNENYFATTSDYFSDYNDLVNEQDYQDCLDDEYNATSVPVNDLDECDYFKEVSEMNYSDACWYINDEDYIPGATSNWTDVYRRMTELCENDIAFWQYDYCPSNAAIDYYDEVAYQCLGYTRVDPSDLQGTNSYKPPKFQSCTGSARTGAKMTNDMYNSCLTSVNNNLSNDEVDIYLDCDVEGYGINEFGCKYIADRPPTCDYTEWTKDYGKNFYLCQEFYANKAKEVCAAGAEPIFRKLQECVSTYKEAAMGSEIMKFMSLAVFAVLALVL